MKRIPFTFRGIEAECRIETDCHLLDDRSFGARIHVPAKLYNSSPYNGSAYTFLQQLRPAIFEFGILEFPDLPVNKTNHTVAMRHPYEHSYSSNAYLNSFFQSPHQDTPPYPTGFWLNELRRYAATWVMSDTGLQQWLNFSQQHPAYRIEKLHRVLVPQSLASGSGLLVNQSPGLLLMDNSEHQRLYHARTCNFDAIVAHPEHHRDSPVYSFSEIGLLNYIDMIDSRRGIADLCNKDREQVEVFMREEALATNKSV